MSGFGGFGSPPPPPPFAGFDASRSNAITINSQQQQQPQLPPLVPFGGTSSSTTTTTNLFGGSNSGGSGFGFTAQSAPTTFGGGFGTQTTSSPWNAPVSNTTGGFFGNPAPTTGSTGFGVGGFGSSANTTNTNPFGGGGFGTAAAATTSNTEASGMTFGSSPNVAATFGQPQLQAANAFGGSSNNMFGSVTVTPSFGTANTANNTGSGFAGFGTTNTTSMAPASSAFGGASTSNPFGSTTTNTNPFGISSLQPAQGPSFGTLSTTTPSTTTPFHNPFAASSMTATTAPAPTISFGTSSNVITNFSGFGSATSNSTSSGFGTGTMAFGGGDSDMSGTSPTPHFFGSPMHQQQLSDSEDMGDDMGGGSGTAASGPFSNLPFGAPVSQQQQHASTSKERKMTPFGTRSDLTPIPEHSLSASNSHHTAPTHSPFISDTGTTATAPAEVVTTPETAQPERLTTALADADKLAKLKAKLQEKKKRLEDQKRRKLQQQQGGSAPPATAAAALNVNAPPFGLNSEQNRQQQDDDDDQDDPQQRQHSLQSAQPLVMSAADRKSEMTRAHLPDDLRIKAERGDRGPSTLTERTAKDRESLQNAKSLIGTCQYMCPDEELLRRQREGDIQLLELPRPNELHPAHWTLRETAVKRFRRSAADYKLDVPEWVRPPDVLEHVCSYLEEWVMERDRQGGDPRFPNGGTPPPLDVYQFIWDRTRIIRKDFILQNYVGSGGNCDARAVRCHERIARWHAMCEHQLSHIHEFAAMQSQQNIQELGQTMKTLNQYYDDHRSLVEVPDDAGRETRLNPEAYKHGCSSDLVQGKNPVDYDGVVLDNTMAAEDAFPRRLIGKHAVSSPHHGTAEPEMRGLYILLTMDNDGGMEVLKYAARLFREKPHIYQSAPVQLALNIYKARKEYNYARFFSILRSPSTPYLFACMMFKHVEIMRKLAFRIMSKTFGGRNKEDNEAMYDEYPLKELVTLLCFEDVDEARAACKHYNIAVEGESVDAQTEEIVYWRVASFKEPKDPDKGTTISLRPRKMIRTIESKLKGATRLAVCRGQVSGEGSYLTDISQPAVSGHIALSTSGLDATASTATSAPAPAGDFGFGVSSANRPGTSLLGGPTPAPSTTGFVPDEAQFRARAEELFGNSSPTSVPCLPSSDEDAKEIKMLRKDVLRLREQALGSNNNEKTDLTGCLNDVLDGADKADSPEEGHKTAIRRYTASDGDDVECGAKADVECGANADRVVDTMRRRPEQEKTTPEPYSAAPTKQALRFRLRGESGERIGKAFHGLGSFLLTRGKFLLSNPLARMLLILYLVLLHCWTFANFFIFAHNFDEHSDSGVTAGVPNGPVSVMVELKRGAAITALSNSTTN